MISSFQSFSSFLFFTDEGEETCSSSNLVSVEISASISGNRRGKKFLSYEKLAPRLRKKSIANDNDPQCLQRGWAIPVKRQPHSRQYLEENP